MARREHSRYELEQKLAGRELEPVEIATALDALAQAGLSTDIDVDPNTQVTPITLETTDGQRYWLGLQNFYVITRYNHSAMYAMAVWELSQAILAARLVP